MFEIHNSYEKIRRRYADLMNNMMTINIKEDNVHLMNISLIPFSLLQVPHIMGNTWRWQLMLTILMKMKRMIIKMLEMMTCDVPGGATAIMELLIRVSQSSEGNQPSAGLRNICHQDAKLEVNVEEPVGHRLDVPLVPECLQDPRVVVTQRDARNLVITIMYRMMFIMIMI